MDRNGLEKRLKEYLQEDIMSEEGKVVAEVNTVNGEMTVLSDKLTEDFVDDKKVTSVIIKDTLENIFPDIEDEFDEEGIKVFKEEGFPMTFRAYNDIPMELKLIDDEDEEEIEEEKDVKFLKPNLAHEDYTLMVNLHKLEKYKDQFDEEEYSRFIDFVEDNIDELVDEDKIIDKFVKAFHVEELVEVD